MIVDIEQTPGMLNISTINKNGQIEYVNIKIPPHEQFNWEYANPGQKCDKDFKSWDDKPVYKKKSYWINKWRIEELLHNQPKVIRDKLYTLNIPKMFFCDIETEVTSDGFPYPEQAKNKITAIAFAYDDKVMGLGTKPLNGEQIKRIENKINNHFKDYGSISFNYIYFESEYDMLYTFLSKYIHSMPLITGWNIVKFDWLYIYNRAVKLNIDPNIASVSKNMVTKNNLPQHRILVDYLEIYKKWDRTVAVKENNSLDFVSSSVLGLQKIKYPGTLQDLYEQDFEEYIFYNAVDTRLVQLIHDKIQTMHTFLTLTNITGVEYSKTMSPIWMTETVIAHEFYERRKVFPNVKNNNKREKYEGAFVFDPKAGLYENVGALDFASLYPSIMRQWNISPETYIKNTDEKITDPKYIQTSTGAVFKNDEDSVFRKVLANYYGQRKSAKNKMQDIEKDIFYLEELLKTKK